MNAVILSIVRYELFNENHSPIVYDLPFGLWIAASDGLLTHHSYHTFFVLHLLQKCTTSSSPAFRCIGSYKKL